MKGTKRKYAKIRKAADLLYEVMDALVYDERGAFEEIMGYLEEAAENAKAAADILEEAQA